MLAGVACARRSALDVGIPQIFVFTASREEQVPGRPKLCAGLHHLNTRDCFGEQDMSKRLPPIATFGAVCHTHTIAILAMPLSGFGLS